MTSDNRIQAGIATVKRGFDAANVIVSSLSVCGELVGIPRPRRASRMQEAVYKFARVAAWLKEIATQMPTLEAASGLDAETLAAIDRFVVVHRIHADPTLFKDELSATSFSIPAIMAAMGTGNALRRFAYYLVGETTGSLYGSECLYAVADKMLHLEPGDKYSNCDDLDRFIAMQQTEAASWGDRFSSIEAALRRELYHAEGPPVAMEQGKTPRKPRADKASPELLLQVWKWRHESKAKSNDEIRILLHSAEFRHLLPKGKADNIEYPSDRTITEMLKEHQETTGEGAK